MKRRYFSFFPTRHRLAAHPAMRILGVLVLLLSAAGCSSPDSGPTAPTTPAAPTVSSIAISGTPAIAPGQTAMLTATATLSNGTTQNVTAQAAWQSSNPSVATVSGGTVLALTLGTTSITATYQGQSAFVGMAVGPSGPAPNCQVGPGGGSMTATIDGAPWTACTITGQISASGGRTGFAILGQEAIDSSNIDTFRTMAISVMTSGPGTYALSSGTDATGAASVSVGSAAWGTFPGSGSITIVSLTTHTASGTFSFNATATGRGTKVVTNGAFNVTF